MVPSFRIVVLLLALLLPAPASAQLAGLAELPLSPIVFTVTHNGSPMGTHRVDFAREGDTTIVDITIRFEVKLAFITVFRYQHNAREVWRGGRLIAFDSLTDDDGDRFQVAARATAEGLRVAGTGGEYLAPAETVPSSYWHRSMTGQPRVLDSQSGRMIDLVATPAGMSEESVGGRRRLPVQLYRLSGEITGELGYTAEDEWALLRFRARGSEIAYTRQ